MIATLQIKKDKVIIVTDMGKRFSVEFDEFIYIRKGTALISEAETRNKAGEPISKYQISFFFKQNVNPINASVTLTDMERDRLLIITKLELEEAIAL